MKIVSIALIVFASNACLQNRQLTVKELKAIKEVEKVGGQFEWVAKNNKEMFCLDVENKSKAFDFQLLTELPRLNVVRVLQGRILERSLVNLSKLSQLELLVITSEGLTDVGLKSIGKLTSLTKLDLMSKSMSKKGLDELKTLRSLKRLFLYNTAITDKDIDPLTKMTWLEELCVPKTVSEAGLSRLRAALRKASVRAF